MQIRETRTAAVYSWWKIWLWCLFTKPSFIVALMAVLVHQLFLMPLHCLSYDWCHYLLPDKRFLLAFLSPCPVYSITIETVLSLYYVTVPLHCLSDDPATCFLYRIKMKIATICVNLSGLGDLWLYRWTTTGLCSFFLLRQKKSKPTIGPARGVEENKKRSTTITPDNDTRTHTYSTAPFFFRFSCSGSNQNPF